MRSAAAQALHEYDLRPAQGDIYVCDVIDRGGKMMKALREWEQKRGIVHSFRGRFIEPKPKMAEQKPKSKPAADRPITVPRDVVKKKPKYTPEEKRKLKNERNKQYRLKNKEKSLQKAREWRKNRTPEQIEKCRQQVREHRARQRAAKQQGSVQAVRVPLSNASVPRKTRAH